jgi:hypothetical protein
MPDERLISILELHGQDVESTGRVEFLRVLEEIALGDSTDLPAFRRRHGFFWESAAGIGPGFHFDENQSRAVEGDDVDFPPEKSVPPGDQLEAFPKQIADGRFLAETA